MLNKRVIPLPGLDGDRLLTNAQYLESALDEWHESGLDTSTDVTALQAFGNKWRKHAMLIALRALRRVEDLRLVQQIAEDTAALTVAAEPGAEAAEKSVTEKRRYSTPEYYEQAIEDWAASGLDQSTNADEFAIFAAKWRLTATLIALRADRRADQLRTLEAHGRELEVRQLLAVETQRQQEVARLASAERAFQAARYAAHLTGENNAASALRSYEQELGDWSARGLDKSEKVNDLVGFAKKWRQDATLVALGAERRVDHLRALEFDARGGRERRGTAADRRPNREPDATYSADEGMAAAAAQAAAASYAYGLFDVLQPVAAARPLIERSYSVTENFNLALDDWHDAGLDDSVVVAKFEAFVARWRKDATLIALRAERRIEALRKQRAVAEFAANAETAAVATTPANYLQYIEQNPVTLPPSPIEPLARTSAEYIAFAVSEWDAEDLELTVDKAALVAFSDRWRRDAELISLRADRRLEELRIEQLRLDPDWHAALRANTVDSYQAFEDKHPQSQYQTELSKRLLLLDEEHAWAKTVAAGTSDAYRGYLQAWPSGTYARHARVGMMGGAHLPMASSTVSIPAPGAAALDAVPAYLPSTDTVSAAVEPVTVVVPTLPTTPATTAIAPPPAPSEKHSPPVEYQAVTRAQSGDNHQVAAAPGSAQAAKAPQRTLLVWLTVAALAAAFATLAYYVLPQAINLATAPTLRQVAKLSEHQLTWRMAQLDGETAGAADRVTNKTSVSAGPNLRAPPDEPIPIVRATIAAEFIGADSAIAVGPAITPARLESEQSSNRLGKIAALDDWNVATAAHAGWSVPLTGLNDWNVATAAHSGWPVPLAGLNDWNVATAAHAGWSVPLAGLNDWNVATAAHAGWSVPLLGRDPANQISSLQILLRGTPGGETAMEQVSTLSAERAKAAQTISFVPHVDSVDVAYGNRKLFESAAIGGVRDPEWGASIMPSHTVDVIGMVLDPAAVTAPTQPLSVENSEGRVQVVSPVKPVKPVIKVILEKLRSRRAAVIVPEEPSPVVVIRPTRKIAIALEPEPEPEPVAKPPRVQKVIVQKSTPAPETSLPKQVTKKEPALAQLVPKVVNSGKPENWQTNIFVGRN